MTIPPFVDGNILYAAQLNPLINQPSSGGVSVDSFGAIGDGESHPASVVLGVTTLAELHAVLGGRYAFADSITLDFAAVPWMLCPPTGNTWWYAEPTVPDTPLDRTGNGRAPEWATHMLMDLNLYNLLSAVDGTDPPPVYLAGFFANVV